MRFDRGKGQSKSSSAFFQWVTYRSPDRFARVTAHDQKFPRHAPLRSETTELISKKSD
jgi:hypothetical protein